MAIARMTLMPNNPLFGLNAIGGALSIDMKNGFNYHGTEAELRGGSYGRVSAGAQSGYQNDNFSAYVAADTIYDRGWRDFSSSSQIRRMYVDLGARGDQTEFHVSFTGADNKLGAVVRLPVTPGYLVEVVYDGSPADRAGVRGGNLSLVVQGEEYLVGGDVLTTIESTAIRTHQDYLAKVKTLRPGQRVRITIVRDGHRRDLTVTVAERPRLPADLLD